MLQRTSPLLAQSGHHATEFQCVRFRGQSGHHLDIAKCPLMMLWTGASGDRRKVDGASPSR